jgi:argininosuccinate synthase
MVDDKWSELAYMGLVHEPLFHDLNAFILESQQTVTGKVDIQLFRGSCRILGRSSPEGIYSGDLVSFDSTSIDQCHAIGVSAYYGIQARLIEQKKKR